MHITNVYKIYKLRRVVFSHQTFNFSNFKILFLAVMKDFVHIACAKIKSTWTCFSSHCIFLIRFRNEVEAQIQQFINLVGYIPNHVDGHQHVQVLPEIRDVIAQVMNSYSLNQIRIPFEHQLSNWFNGDCDFYNKVFEDAKTAIDVYSNYRIRLEVIFFFII